MADGTLSIKSIMEKAVANILTASACRMEPLSIKSILKDAAANILTTSAWSASNKNKKLLFHASGRHSRTTCQSLLRLSQPIIMILTDPAQTGGEGRVRRVGGQE